MVNEPESSSENQKTKKKIKIVEDSTDWIITLSHYSAGLAVLSSMHPFIFPIVFISSVIMQFVEYNAIKNNRKDQKPHFNLLNIVILVMAVFFEILSITIVILDNK